jgi:hypothetical protein
VSKRTSAAGSRSKRITKKKRTNVVATKNYKGGVESPEEKAKKKALIDKKKICRAEIEAEINKLPTDLHIGAKPIFDDKLRSAEVDNTVAQEAMEAADKKSRELTAKSEEERKKKEAEAAAKGSAPGASAGPGEAAAPGAADASGEKKEEGKDGEKKEEGKDGEKKDDKKDEKKDDKKKDEKKKEEKPAKTKGGGY